MSTRYGEAHITQHEDNYFNVPWQPYIIDYNSIAIVMIFLFLSFLPLSIGYSTVRNKNNSGIVTYMHRISTFYFNAPADNLGMDKD
ncbi:hypothetical protein BDV41DRAFT_526467 [Aspergillus transmontanensis]|uniref:Uncharacterized protein n=1 Tax=Aspergillus transmontanensis TaxID=1034304 RepID=A0A5N6W961_9EURO|nr:hypothetical protein BDV41DRAFT_526467 [Aspergillus transmontanensis]